MVVVVVVDDVCKLRDGVLHGLQADGGLEGARRVEESCGRAKKAVTASANSGQKVSNSGDMGESARGVQD